MPCVQPHRWEAAFDEEKGEAHLQTSDTDSMDIDLFDGEEVTWKNPPKLHYSEYKS